ncbi:hypothetical protein KTS45_09995 [Halomicroarcula limicola]|uniref:Uncharacterized protein n=1 Tax=Haloarcula limicola TaxID=1429915 RepID=A0A8J7YAY0_9EURY|nr:hypothetical protein [Halomicroarcula limicola]MBV0924529.1 hypothetical protein [Halomicroarcula limicola]
MKILVIDQCSGSKNYPEALHELTQEEVDSGPVEQLLERPDTAGIPANELYSGRQQQRINEAVEVLRSKGHKVDRKFVSAGFGLIDEREELPPYEITFSGMNHGEIDQRAERLQIAEEVCELLTETSDDPFDIIFFALGSDYYHAIDLDQTLASIPDSTLVILFNQEERAGGNDRVISISARTDDAKRYSTIVVALKGVYVKNFAQQVGREESISNIEKIREGCLATETTQSGFDEFA